jgi:DNA polymerase-3 subunit delta'
VFAPCQRPAPDLQVVEREGDVIRIEQVERLVAELALKPFVSQRRVWVILEAETLTREAANKLLKSLGAPAHVYSCRERPPERLPTIASRCQTIEFRVRRGRGRRRLPGRGFAAGARPKLANPRAAGGPRRAPGGRRAGHGPRALPGLAAVAG